MAIRKRTSGFHAIIYLALAVAFGVVSLAVTYKAFIGGGEVRSKAASTESIYRQWEFNGKDSEGWTSYNFSGVKVAEGYWKGLAIGKGTVPTLSNSSVKTALPQGNKMVKLRMAVTAPAQRSRKPPPAPTYTFKVTLTLGGQSAPRVLAYKAVADGVVKDYALSIPDIAGVFVEKMSLEFPGFLLNSAITLDYIRLTGPGPVSVTPTPIARFPKISWVTPSVELYADSMEIKAGGRTFYGVPDKGTTMTIGSDPGSSTYTTLEAQWQEQGMPMRAYFYFWADKDSWGSKEIRTYDGNNPGEWLYYDGSWMKASMGSPYKTDSVTIESGDKGSLTFKGLSARAFMFDNRVPPLTPITTKLPPPPPSTPSSTSKPAFEVRY